mgnify:CR=1 FL=1
MILRKIIFLGIFITLLGCGSSDLNITKIVELKNGSIKGAQEGDLKKYLGIPYAEPPLGDLRWAPAKPAKNWEGMRSAETNSKICFQPKQIADFYDRVPDLNNMSEDCLTLNVWTRAKDTNEKLPVMGWCHGGALVWGSGSEYPGNELTKHGVILVTVNYRLGPFGFFSHPELSIETGSSGNQGFSDQIQSLKWVKENISQFGGDTNNITIINGCHQYGASLVGRCPYGVWDPSGTNLDGTKDADWPLSIWISNRAFSAGVAYDVLLHESLHAFTYSTRNCPKNSNTNYRQDARDFFGGEEFLVDALVLYYGGKYNHYRTSGELNSGEQTYLTDYINTCSA